MTKKERKGMRFTWKEEQRMSMVCSVKDDKVKEGGPSLYFSGIC